MDHFEWVKNGRKRGLYEESSFWNAGKELLRNEDGYEVQSVGRSKIIFRTPEGRDLTLRADYTTGEWEQSMYITFRSGLAWDDSNKEVRASEVSWIRPILEDAAKAWEYDVYFWIDIDSEDRDN